MCLLCILFVLLFFAFCGDSFKSLSDEEYQSAYRILQDMTGRSNFQEVIAEKVKKKIEMGTVVPGRFLDVGSGTGVLTRKISSLFDDTVVLEPNFAFFEELEKDFHGFNLLFDAFVDKHGEDEEMAFDFILCSHVFYHVPVDQWRGFVKKMTQFLKPSGVLLVVMEERGSHMNLVFDKYKPGYLGSLKEESDIGNMKREFFNSYHQLTTNNINDFRIVFKFLVMENCYANDNYNEFSDLEKEKIDRSIEEDLVALYREDSGDYSLEWLQVQVLLTFDNISANEKKDFGDET